MFGRKKKPPGPPSSQQLLRCSFCNKSQRCVRTIIAGPNVQICDECVDICLDILAEKRKEAEDPVTFVEGASHDTGRSYPRPTTLLLCGLCRRATSLEHSLVMLDRGFLCAGCIQAMQASLGESSDTPDA